MQIYTCTMLLICYIGYTMICMYVYIRLSEGNGSKIFFQHRWRKIAQLALKDWKRKQMFDEQN